MDEFTHPIILRRKRRGIKPEVIQLRSWVAGDTKRLILL
jgi:hypothetical protein